eukprot:6775759-Pyramimonas_sp.AAC.1
MERVAAMERVARQEDALRRSSAANPGGRGQEDIPGAGTRRRRDDERLAPARVYTHPRGVPARSSLASLTRLNRNGDKVSGPPPPGLEEVEDEEESRSRSLHYYSGGGLGVRGCAPGETILPARKGGRTKHRPPARRRRPTAGGAARGGSLCGANEERAGAPPVS